MITELSKKVMNMFDKADSDYSGEPWFFKLHIRPVMKLAWKLAEKYNADKDIVEAAACLHDIGLINVGKKDHAKHGAERARKILSEMNYDSKFIDRVCACIETHMSNVKLPVSKEAKIVSTADGLSHLTTNWFKVKRKHSKLTDEKYKQWCLKKIKTDLKKIHFSDEKKLAEKHAKELLQKLKYL